MRTALQRCEIKHEVIIHALQRQKNTRNNEAIWEMYEALMIINVDPPRLLHVIRNLVVAVGHSPVIVEADDAQLQGL